MIVIVTGGRNYAGTGLVEALDALERECPGFDLSVGDAAGADAIARRWADDHDRCRPVIVFPADWAQHGKSAGPRRNADMVDHAFLHRGFEGMDEDGELVEERVICLAAPGGRGTADCVRRCREAGFEVREVTA